MTLTAQPDGAPGGRYRPPGAAARAQARARCPDQDGSAGDGAARAAAMLAGPL